MKKNNLTEFNEGGLHSQNPLGGIPLGTSNDGSTNAVEQGETKNGNYIYSNRLSISPDLAKQMFLPNYIKNKSFADASKSINNKFKDRNDTHSNTTKKELLDRLTQAQESVKAQQEQINQAIQANSQQIPDQMNGEIPEGMEQFAEGGYFDNNPELSNNILGGLGIANSLGTGNTEDALMGGAELAASKGLLGAGAQSAVGSFAPGIGAVQGTIGLNELAKGNGASRNKIGSAATGAMTGAMAGAGFGPAGIIAGGAIGAIAGGIGSGNKRKQDAELGSLNAKNANNVFRDKQYNFSNGGPLDPEEGTLTNEQLTKSLSYMYQNPGTNVPLNAQFGNQSNSFKNVQASIGVTPDGILGPKTKNALTNWSLQNSQKFRNLPSKQKNYNEFSNGHKTNFVMSSEAFNNIGLTPGGRQFLEPVSNLISTGTTYNNLQSNISVNDINKTPLTNSEIQEKRPSFLNKLSNNINNNTVGNALRLAPVAMNAYQSAKLKKPGHESLSRLSNTYKPQFIDEASLQNAIGNENRNTINALTNSSGGSEAALRAGILGANLNATRGRSDAYMKMRDYNNQQNIAKQQFQLGVDQTNMGQSNMENEINAKNLGNYDTQKSKLLGQIGTDLGSIGKERVFADKAGKMFGYDENGNYIITPDGKKTYTTTSKTTVSAYGGFLKTNKRLRK